MAQKLIPLLLLTLVLVSCGEIRLELGADDDFDVTLDSDGVGTWVLGETGVSNVPTTFLLNTKTGELKICNYAEGSCSIIHNADAEGSSGQDNELSQTSPTRRTAAELERLRNQNLIIPVEASDNPQ